MRAGTVALRRDLVPVLGGDSNPPPRSISPDDGPAGRVYHRATTLRAGCCAGEFRGAWTETTSMPCCGFRSARATAISETIDRRDHSVSQRLRGIAAIDAIHDEGGDVLQMIGDGSVAVVHQRGQTSAKRADAAGPSMFRGQHDFDSKPSLRSWPPDDVAYVGRTVGLRVLWPTSAARTGSFHRRGAGGQRGSAEHRIDVPFGRS